MPIKPENIHRYPDSWSYIREKIKERAKDKCEECGVVNFSWINRFTREMCLSDECDAIRVVCTVAHLDHTPEICSEDNLKFLCQRCHNRYDVPHRKETRYKTRMKGQLEMSFGVFDDDPFIMKIMFSTRLLINTSVDDIRSSLNCAFSHYHTREENKAYIIELEENIKAEKSGRNRSSVIKLLESKVKSLRKSL